MSYSSSGSSLAKIGLCSVILNRKDLRGAAIGSGDGWTRCGVTRSAALNGAFQGKNEFVLRGCKKGLQVFR
jgi:hypothetical protein